MRFNLPIPTIAVCTVVALAVLSTAPANASALIIGHNGTMDSSPHQGTGAADVRLDCIPNGTTAEECQKTFFSNDRHEINWSGTGLNLFDEAVINSTGIAWTDFHLEFLGFDALPEPLFRLECAAGTNDDCATMDMMVEENNKFVWLFFNEPFTPGIELDSFIFGVELTGSGTIIQRPSIPEPGTLAIMGIGLVGLGFARRRKAA